MVWSLNLIYQKNSRGLNNQRERFQSWVKIPQLSGTQESAGKKQKQQLCLDTTHHSSDSCSAVFDSTGRTQLYKLICSQNITADKSQQNHLALLNRFLRRDGVPHKNKITSPNRDSVLILTPVPVKHLIYMQHLRKIQVTLV